MTPLSQSMYFLMNSSRVGSLEAIARPGSDELRPGKFLPQNFYLFPSNFGKILRFVPTFSGKVDFFTESA